MHRDYYFSAVLCLVLLIGLWSVSTSSLIWGAEQHPAQTAALGCAAPDFVLPDIYKHTHRLHDYKGKFVVLEWVNFQCPFVKKHYDSGNMQKLQKTYTGKGIIWLTICSSAAGRPGCFLPEQISHMLKEKGSAATAYLLDTPGTVGKLYDAKATPAMYVINPRGVLIYAGAIDDRPTTDLADIAEAKNYVQAALDEALAGKPIQISSTKQYGCSIKYAQ